MKNFFYYFIENYKLTFSVIASGLMVGAIGMFQLKRETRPPVDFARVIITTVHPGSSAEEVEEFITNKIEEELQNITGIKDSDSVSMPGMSEITLQLDMDNVDTEKTVTDIYRAMQNVKNLPKDLLDPPKVFHFKAEEIPILDVAVTGPNQGRIRDETAYELKSLIELLPLVSRVTLENYRKKEFQILLNADKMNRFSVSISEVIKAVEGHTKNISAGMVWAEQENNLIKVLGKVNSADKMSRIVVRSNFSGRQIFLKDIAKVVYGKEDQNNSTIINGQPAVSLRISKTGGADIIKAVDQINKIIDRYKKTAPEEVKIFTLRDESKNSKKRLKIVSQNAVFGLILVLLILMVSLSGWLGLASAVSLPFSIMATVALISSMGVTFNVITMCAFIICIGMLVDNSIVISENYVQHRQKGDSPKPAALNSVMELWKPVFATTITTVLAFLPMLITKGVMGEFIKWIPIVVSCALCIGLVESFLLLPCRLSFTVSSQNNKKKWDPFLKLQKWFEPFIIKVINRRYIALSVIFVILAGSLSINLFANKFILFPKENIEWYSAEFDIHKGLSLKKFEEKTKVLESKVRSIMKNKNLEYTHAYINNIQGKGFLYFKVYEDIALHIDHKENLEKLRVLKSESLFKFLRFEALRPGPRLGRPVKIILYSHNEDQLKEAAQKMFQQISSIEGILNVEDSESYTGPEYSIEPDIETLSRLGFNTLAAGQALRTAFQGHIAGEMTERGESFYVRVKYDSQGRAAIDTLQNIHLLAPAGQLIPLNQVVKWTKNKQGEKIKKGYAFRPSITIKGDVDIKKITSVTANAKILPMLKKTLKDYPAVSYKQSGEQERTQESIESLFKAMIVVLCGIFSVLLVMFNSFSTAILVLSNVLLGLIGISWAFFLHGKPLSFFAMIGTVGLAGVVINSAIILVSYIENLRKKNPNIPLSEILAKAASRRFRPILITTLTTVLGLLPTAYGFGGYDRILVPITLSLTWGLISGTLFTLIWTTCGYAVIDDASKWITKKIKMLWKR